MFIEWILQHMLFFFSSRRRHTRLQGDWSSDVCSSDLRAGVDERPREAAHAGRPNVVLVVADSLRADHLGPWGYAGGTSRSEERRVGKEWRSVWAWFY